MADARALLDRLSSVYRPEPADGTLLAAFADAVAAEVQRARDEASMVLPAHWYLHADRAALDPWFSRRRQVAPLPPLGPGDLVDYADARGFLTRVKDANSPLAEYLRMRLDEPTGRALDDWDALGPPPPALAQRVLIALNRLVRGELLYQEQRFAGVTLSPATLALVQDEIAPADRPRVNVLLLLEAFPTLLRRALLDLPWVRDLGRLGGLVPLLPWREPASLRESAEAFRIRLGRTIRLHRQGLGTRAALRAAVETALPVALDRPPELRDPPFTIEELAPLVTRREAAATNGPPTGLVGPLMRWSLDHGGVGAVAPEICITGIEPAGLTAATIAPLVELYQAAGSLPRVAIGYRRTIEPGATLRLRPAHISWLLGEAGLERADHLPQGEVGANPGSPGAAQAVADAPAEIAAFLATSDGSLWAAAANGTALARFNGEAWFDVAADLPEIHCLAGTVAALLLGTAAGLLRLPLYPAGDAAASPAPVPGFEAVDVRVLTPAAGGGFWIGTGTGALFWSGSGAPEQVPLGGDVAVSTRVHAIHADGDRAVHFGCDLGAFEYQPARDTWYWYAGGSFSEQQPEWVPFLAAPAGAPAEGSVFLPAVLAVHRGPDTALWFGTTHGIARYTARAVNGGTYTTLLEAFPDLGTGPVTQIREDERGGVWFATERGLLRFDGRDWWQRRDGDWVHLGRGDVLPGPAALDRGGWRFLRGVDRWQRFDPRSGGWAVPPTPLRTTAEPAVRAVQVADHVVAELGALEGDVFVPASPVPVTDLVLRIKPAEDRIVTGGMPYIPRLPPGVSTWRYLQLEPVDMTEPDAAVRPAWSCEGRLFPPPPALDAPFAGRFDVDVPADGHFDQAVFAYPPAARVRFDYAPRQRCSVLVRLYRGASEQPYDPAIIERTWEGMQLVRPAGVRTLLAVNETIVKGS